MVHINICVTGLCKHQLFMIMNVYIAPYLHVTSVIDFLGSMCSVHEEIAAAFGLDKRPQPFSVLRYSNYNV